MVVEGHREVLRLALHPRQRELKSSTVSLPTNGRRFGLKLSFVWFVASVNGSTNPVVGTQDGGRHEYIGQPPASYVVSRRPARPAARCRTDQRWLTNVSMLVGDSRAAWWAGLKDLTSPRPPGVHTSRAISWIPGAGRSVTPRAVPV